MQDDRSIVQQFTSWREPNFKIEEFEKKTEFREKVMLCQRAWASIGFGTPLLIISFYILKMWLFLWAWSFLCGRMLSNIGEWFYDRDAFTRMLLWAISFENFGLGCASGPLTGKFLPPFTSIQHWLRPGTYRSSYFVDHPNRVLRALFGGNKRSLIDVCAVLALHFFIYRALLKNGPLLTSDFLPVIIVIGLEGLRDRTFFLSTREEHYWVMLIGLLAPGNAGVGAIKIVSAAIWFYAGVSKLNPHFSYACMNMIANHPFVPYFIRRAVYRDFPTDLRPSRFARLLAHGTTSLEVGGTPLLMLLPPDSMLYRVVLVAYLLLHIQIILSVPAAVPNEWNLVMLYQLGYLWYHHASVSPLSAFQSPLIAAIVVFSSVIVPLYGNFRPDQVSFLSAMRYYAGNWCYGPVIFTDGYDGFIKRVHEARAKGKIYSAADIDMRDSLRKLKLSRAIENYVLYTPATFLFGHLPYIGLQALMPQYIPSQTLANSFVTITEMMQTWMLGWSFGDGHLGGQDLWREFATALGYKPNEAYCFIVEGAPLFGSSHQVTVYDGSGAIVGNHSFKVADLLKMQPDGSTSVK